MEIWDAGDNYDDANKIENEIKILRDHSAFLLYNFVQQTDFRCADGGRLIG